MTIKITFAIVFCFLIVLACLNSLGFRSSGFYQKPLSAVSTNMGLNNALPQSCYVVVVYDGDTIACDFNNNHYIDGPEERIRLLGIDSPETSHSPKNKTGKDEPFAQDAKKYLDKLAWHHTVYLHYDVKPVDKYNRKLAFVSLDEGGKDSLNLKMLSSGLAKLLFIEPNHKHFLQYQQAESTAQKNHLALWQ